MTFLLRAIVWSFGDMFGSFLDAPARNVARIALVFAFAMLFSLVMVFATLAISYIAGVSPSDCSTSYSVMGAEKEC